MSFEDEARPDGPITSQVPAETNPTGTTFQVIGVIMVIASVSLFRFVGVPVTTTYSMNGVSESVSWGHVFVYAAIGLIGGLLIWIGRAPER
jgi:hypothetical protein